MVKYTKTIPNEPKPHKPDVQKKIDEATAYGWQDISIQKAREKPVQARLDGIEEFETIGIPCDVSDYQGPFEPVEERGSGEGPEYYSWEQAYELMDCRWSPVLNQIIGKKRKDRNATIF